MITSARCAAEPWLRWLRRLGCAQDGLLEEKPMTKREKRRAKADSSKRRNYDEIRWLDDETRKKCAAPPGHALRPLRCAAARRERHRGARGIGGVSRSSVCA